MTRTYSPRAIADFDSASGMARALGRFLHGKDFPNLGMSFLPESLVPVLPSFGIVLNALPKKVKEAMYTNAGRLEALRPETLGEVDAGEVARWFVSLYPDRRYPAAFVGSSNGALTHLAAAMGVPYLPQTFLIPVRRDGRPEEPQADLEWGREPARRLLEANPDLVLHHMHDPSQDHLMVRRMAYFRVKWRRLPEAYRQFLENALEPGATLFVVECGQSWPTTRVDDRHLFQFGAVGGATAEEFHEGGPRVEEHLRRIGSSLQRWPAPEPDADRPEAEWGFEPAIRDDLERLAADRGWHLRRIAFDAPTDASPTVADLHRRAYRHRGQEDSRLLADSFIVMDPWWTLRTGSVPFWMVFNTERSASALEHYLDLDGPFDEIYMTLFSHGVESIGLAPIERWRSILHRARRRSAFVGVDEARFPSDYSVFANFHARLPDTIPARVPMPDPLMTLDDLDTFLDEAGNGREVRWIGEPPPVRP